MAVLAEQMRERSNAVEVGVGQRIPGRFLLLPHIEASKQNVYIHAELFCRRHPRSRAVVGKLDGHGRERKSFIDCATSASRFRSPGKGRPLRYAVRRSLNSATHGGASGLRIN